MIDYNAKVIAPVTLADSLFVSSTAPETDYSTWNPGTAYTLGQKCIRVSTHRIYERKVAGTTATAPELDTTNWMDIGPTNRWAMFDDVVGTQTTLASPLTVVINPGAISGLALMELVGRSVAITYKDATGGTVVYSHTDSLDGTIIESFYDWFYTPFVQATDLVLTDLPAHFPNGELTISITGTGSVSCGVCKVGEVIGIGSTEYGATSGIIDYSVKTTDTFGRTSITRRSFSKRASLSIITNAYDYNRISRSLASLRATPAVWIGSEKAGYEPLIIYGFFKDFSMNIAYSELHYCSLELEGLI